MLKLKSLGGLRNVGEGLTVKVLSNDALKISDKALVMLGATRKKSRVDVAQDTGADTPTFYIYVTSKEGNKDLGGFKVNDGGAINSKSICELLGGKDASFTISEKAIMQPYDEEDESKGSFPVYQLIPAGAEATEEEEEEDNAPAGELEEED